MTHRHIKQVAVLGSGVMGSQIACHLANAGLKVLLLDMAPTELNATEQAKGLGLDHPDVRNRIVRESLQKTLKMNPSPIYKATFSSRISTGNFTDDLSKIADCQWIIEVVVERLDIKQRLFEEVEKFRRPGTLITTNTSGIPIESMTLGRSTDFTQHFCGTHFFNPPRYLALMEIIPSSQTLPEVIEFFVYFGERVLGKKTVLCKDTPAFIANRIGVFSIMSLFHSIRDLGLSIDDIDKLTGPVLGRPKSATFRTCDVVGLDTLVHVANGLKEHCKQDERHPLFEIPDYIEWMMQKQFLGAKSGQGFYKKTKDAEGNTKILSLDLQTLEYGPSSKQKFPTLDMTRSIEDLRQRTKMLVMGTDKAGAFYRRMFGELFAYVSHRIPEITDDLYQIDEALKAGFAWELGPFETWDLLGFEQGLKLIHDVGQEPAAWVKEMQEKGFHTFYHVDQNQLQFYKAKDALYHLIPGSSDRISLQVMRKSQTIWKNSDTTITDLGDGILNLEFHTKMNTIGGGVIEGINKAIDLAESAYNGLVISNEGQHFSAGANVGMIFMMAVEQDFDELNMAVKIFQDTMMRIRYCEIPVVVAPHNLALGGGCELAMHADKVVAHAELYMGLVEFGVGLIPGGGGSKEFAKRLSDELIAGDIKINRMRERFLTIGQAKVATSAYEAFDLGYLVKGRDEVVMSRSYQLNRAKQVALELAQSGYVPPKREKNILAMGREGLGIVYVGAHSMLSGRYISEHDALISEKLGYVMCGGDLSENTWVSEQYLLDLERKAFLELCAERKTLERLQSLIKTGKILRN
jgi:3-hydroxyacyl-CoA dehydrogenase